jgi:hypothetical protein
MSDLSLQALDITDRDNPAQLAAMDLARPVDRFAVINGYGVEVAGDWYRGDTEIVVTPANAPDTTTPVARLRVPAPYAQSYVDGSILWLTAWNYDSTTGNQTAWLQAVDLTDPTQPRLRGKLMMNPQDLAWWGWWSWGYGNETQLVGHALALHPYHYSCYGNGCPAPTPDIVEVFDLSNPDAPQLASTVVLPNSDWSWGLNTVGNFAWITHYEWVPNSNWQNVRYFIDRIDLSNPYAPNLLPKVNVPGVFFQASDDGNTVYVEEVSWSSDYSTTTTTIHSLGLSGDVATLEGSVSLNGYPGGQAVSSGQAYVQTWSWSQQNSQSQVLLATVDLTAMNLSNVQGLNSNSGWLMKASGGKLFISAGWFDYGLLVYDLTSPDVPAYQGFFRTDGYVEDIVVSGGVAYLPSGYYGVPMIDLTPGSPLPFH